MAYAFEYEGTEYVLEFDRASIEKAERTMGLTPQDIASGKASSFPDLFRAALLKHHPHMKTHTVKMLYSLQEDKVGLHGDLAEMYGEVYESLFEEPPEGKAIARRKV